jgi:hypothetical protein
MYQLPEFQQLQPEAVPAACRILRDETELFEGFQKAVRITLEHVRVLGNFGKPQRWALVKSVENMAKLTYRGGGFHYTGNIAPYTGSLSDSFNYFELVI